MCIRDRKRKEEVMILKAAELQVARDMWGPDGDPRDRHFPRRPRQSPTSEASEEGAPDDQADYDEDEDLQEAARRSVFESPASTKGKGKGPITPTLPVCPYNDSSSDESDTETRKALSGVEIVLHKLEAQFGENLATYTMNVMQDFIYSGSSHMNLWKKL